MDFDRCQVDGRLTGHLKPAEKRHSWQYSSHEAIQFNYSLLYSWSCKKRFTLFLFSFNLASMFCHFIALRTNFDSCHIYDKSKDI